MEIKLPNARDFFIMLSLWRNNGYGKCKIIIDRGGTLCLPLGGKWDKREKHLLNRDVFPDCFRDGTMWPGYRTTPIPNRIHLGSVNKLWFAVGEMLQTGMDYECSVEDENCVLRLRVTSKTFISELGLVHQPRKKYGLGCDALQCVNHITLTPHPE